MVSFPSRLAEDAWDAAPDPRSRPVLEATNALFRSSFARVNSGYGAHSEPPTRCEEDFIAPKHRGDRP
jgi:hypothetical protein